MADLPGVFLRLIDDKALSVGASLLLEQNSEQTSAAEKVKQCTVKLQTSNIMSH